MAKLYNLARMTTATTGTGTITLGSVVPGYLTFAQAGVLDTEVITYAIQDGANSEIGRGTYTASGTTLARTTILRSTNANAAISLSGGAEVFITAAAEDIKGMVRKPGGRLTLTSATPVLTADVSAATTVYYTPYDGRMVIPVYDGTDWYSIETGELSNVLANSATGNAGPAAGAAASVYDLFVWDNAGTPRLTRGPLWTNDTTRSAGTALVNVNGINLNNASITNGPAASRGTYVGTIRTDAGAAQVSMTIVNPLAAGGGAIWVGLWNAYNRVDLDSTARDSTGSHTYGTNTLRAWNGGTGMRATFVRGLDEDSVRAIFIGEIAGSSGNTCSVGIGLDVTNARAAGSGGGAHSATTNEMSIPATYGGLPGLGVHFLQGLEHGSAGTNTFFGNYGTSSGGSTQYGSCFSVHLRY